MAALGPGRFTLERNPCSKPLTSTLTIQCNCNWKSTIPEIFGECTLHLFWIYRTYWRIVHLWVATLITFNNNTKLCVITNNVVPQLFYLMYYRSLHVKACCFFISVILPSSMKSVLEN